MKKLLVFLFIAIILSVTVRLYFGTYPFTDQWAENAAIAHIKNQGKSVEQELPKYEKVIDEKSEGYKELYQDPEGNFYLIGIDPYIFYKQAKDGDFDSFLPVFSYYLNKFLPGNLMKSSFYIPIIFMALTIIPVFFLGRRVGGEMGGIISAFVFAIHPEFLKYSLAGQADTNTLNVFFFMAISWLFVELFYHKKQRRIYAGISLIVLLLLFRFTWSGYYLVAMLMIGCSILFALLYLFNKFVRKKQTRLIIIVSIILASSIGYFLFFRILLDYLPRKIQVFLGKPAGGLFPHSYFTISELQTIALSDLVFRLGGLAFVMIVLFAGFTIIRRTIRKRKIPSAYLVVLSAAIAFVSTGNQALRILPFSIPFLCILLGIGIKDITGLIKFKKASTKRIYTGAVLLIVIIFLYVPFAQNIKKVSIIKPRMDDSIYNTAIDIKEDSSDAQIFVWWDKGHLFDAISDRNVFQQAVPRMPRAYWMAKALMTNDENLSKGIIRMLACKGENKAFAIINSEYNAQQTIHLIDGLLVTYDPEMYVQENNIKESILKQTHCDAPTVYLVLTDDMYTKSHTLQYYANWDFWGAEVSELTKDLNEQDSIPLLMEKLGLTESVAKQAYEESRKDRRYRAFKQYDCSKSAQKYTCNIDGQSISVDFDTNKINYKPSKLIVIDGERKEFSFNNSQKVLIIYKRRSNYHAVYIDESLANSMYVKLLLLGETEFEPFRDYVEATTLRTRSYKVEW